MFNMCVTELKGILTRMPRVGFEGIQLSLGGLNGKNSRLLLTAQVRAVENTVLTYFINPCKQFIYQLEYIN